MGINVARDGRVVSVILDRPPVNALTLALYEELTEIFTAFEQQPEVSCVILSAAGDRSFCAGLDLKEFVTATVEEDPARALIVRNMFHAVRHSAVPVIAAVQGPALGAGCVLASVSDIRIASTKALFGLAEINVGRCGGTAHMGRHVSPGMLREMFFTGQPIDAETAYRVGFVQHVVAPDALMPFAEDMAQRIAAKAPLGLRIGKISMNAAESLPVDEGYQLEQGYSTRLMATEDAREATRAVIEKRPPVFVGR